MNDLLACRVLFFTVKLHKRCKDPIRVQQKRTINYGFFEKMKNL